MSVYRRTFHAAPVPTDPDGPTIEAVRYDGSNEPDIAAFVGADLDRQEDLPGMTLLLVPLAHGDVWIQPGDWVAHGPGGLEVHSGKLFDVNHEPVDG